MKDKAFGQYNGLLFWPSTCLKKREVVFTFFFLPLLIKKTRMTFPRYYSVQTVFGHYGPITVRDLVKDYNAQLDKARLGKAYHLNADSVRQYLRNRNTLGHFGNLMFTKCHGTMIDQPVLKNSEEIPQG